MQTIVNERINNPPNGNKDYGTLRLRALAGMSNPQQDVRLEIDRKLVWLIHIPSTSMGDSTGVWTGKVAA